MLILETESGSPPATPEIPQKLPAPAVFRDDPRHSAREEISPSYSGGSVASEASARSSASAAPSMADVLLVVKRAGGGENLTVHSTTRDVAVEIEVRKKMMTIGSPRLPPPLWSCCWQSCRQEPRLTEFHSLLHSAPS